MIRLMVLNSVKLTRTAALSIVSQMMKLFFSRTMRSGFLCPRRLSTLSTIKLKNRNFVLECSNDKSDLLLHHKFNSIIRLSALTI